MDQVKASIPNWQDVQGLWDGLKQKVPHNYSDIEKYIEQFKAIDKDEIVNDFSQLKVTPATVTISVVALTTVVIIGRLLSGTAPAPAASKPKKKKKKVSKAQKTNKEIQDILDNFEDQWVPKINDYLANYKTLSKGDVQYQYNYFEEMLLKELMKLDGIDVLGNDIIRENRKKVIKFIQDHQKRLDAFKKEVL